jgi:DNA-binding PadR family transcriptional regulator
MEDMQRFAGIRLGPGTLYGAITRLEEHGWIRPVGSEDRRRPYRLTADGRQYLKEQVARPRARGEDRGTEAETRVRRW